MELEDLVVIGATAYVITDIQERNVLLAPLSHTGLNEISVPKDRVLAVGTYRRVE